MAIYIISFVSYGATLVFYAAAFPRLARNTPHARALRERLENNEISREEYEREESLEKNRISNISTVRSRGALRGDVLMARVCSGIAILGTSSRSA